MDICELLILGTPVSLQASARSRERWKARVRSVAEVVVPEEDQLNGLLYRDLRVWVVYFHLGEMDGDLDNIAKPLLDGLTGAVWSNDRQIAHLKEAQASSWSSHFGSLGDCPGRRWIAGRFSLGRCPGFVTKHANTLLSEATPLLEHTGTSLPFRLGGMHGGGPDPSRSSIVTPLSSHSRPGMTPSHHSGIRLKG